MNSSLLLRVQGDMEYINNQPSPTTKAFSFPLLSMVASNSNIASDLSQVRRLWKSQQDEELTSTNIYVEIQQAVRRYSLILYLPLTKELEVPYRTNNTLVSTRMTLYLFLTEVSLWKNSLLKNY
ncbi:hypothetical protein NIES2098_43780 [Calothrix sp. NIES-2098]|nr:hypothetical protein NIES2098_43780 [Calothrix sp. NIES-2098]